MGWESVQAGAREWSAGLFELHAGLSESIDPSRSMMGQTRLFPGSLQ
jgi:hypothetical protein